MERLPELYIAAGNPDLVRARLDDARKAVEVSGTHYQGGHDESPRSKQQRIAKRPRDPPIGLTARAAPTE